MVATCMASESPRRRRLAQTFTQQVAQTWNWQEASNFKAWHGWSILCLPQPTDDIDRWVALLCVEVGPMNQPWPLELNMTFIVGGSVRSCKFHAVLFLNYIGFPWFLGISPEEFLYISLHSDSAMEHAQEWGSQKDVYAYVMSRRHKMTCLSMHLFALQATYTCLDRPVLVAWFVAPSEILKAHTWEHLRFDAQEHRKNSHLDPVAHGIIMVLTWPFPTLHSFCRHVFRHSGWWFPMVEDCSF